MEILVVILVVAIIAIIAYFVMQRRSSGAGGLGHAREAPLGRRDRVGSHRDPMAAAVHEHAQATDPHDAMVAEQRLQAQASQVAAGLTAGAHRDMAAEHQRAANEVGRNGAYAPEPAVGGYAGADPAYANDPAYAPSTDPRSNGQVDPGQETVPEDYDDRRFDGRRAEDWVDPRYDDRAR